MTFVANTPLTAAQLNAHLRDNLNETAPAKATAAGQIFAATGANAIAARTPSTATVATGQTTTSTASYGDLTTVGPSVTVTTGPKALVIVTAQIENSTGGGGGYMSYEISGATTSAAANNRAIRAISANTNERTRYSAASIPTLTAGSNTFTAKYTTPTGGTATFTDRDIIVIPF